MTIEHEDLRQRSRGCLPTTFFGFVGAEVHSLLDEYDAVVAENEKLRELLIEAVFDGSVMNGDWKDRVHFALDRD